MLSARLQAEFPPHGLPGDETLVPGTSLVSAQQCRGGQQRMRDALLLIARSSAGGSQHRRVSPAPETPLKPGVAPGAAPLTPTLSVNRVLPPHTASSCGRGAFVSPADCAMAITTGCSSRAPGSAPLESPVRRRQAALRGLEAAKAEMACAMQQLRACACDLRVQRPPESAGVADAQSP